MVQSPTLIKTHHVTVDVDIKNEAVGAIKQNNVNSIKFIIHVTDNGEPFNLDPVTEATITIKRPDGGLSNSILSESGNTLEYLCEPNAINMPGIYEAEVQLYGSANNLLLTSSFFYQVVSSLANDDGITEQAEYPLLIQLIADVGALEQNVTTSETLRVTSEQTRVTNENLRIQNESTRQATEISRTSVFSTYQDTIAAISDDVHQMNDEMNEFIHTQVVNFSVDRTLLLTDKNKYLRATSNSTPQIITVPTNDAVLFPVGTVITITRSGLANVTIANASGVTVNSREGRRIIDGQHASVTLIKIGTNAWDLIGAI